MAKLIFGNEELLLPWAQERVGVTFRRDAYTIGLEKNGELVAVVVFDSFSEFDCNMHIASDGSSAWMSKSLLISAFSYPFVQLKLNRVTGLVPETNTVALAFDEHLGFVREGLHPMACADGALVSLGMTRSSCRFIPKDPSNV